MPGLLWLKWHGGLIQLRQMLCQAFTECTSFSKMCEYYSKNLKLNLLSCKSRRPTCTAIPGRPEACRGTGEMWRTSSLECLGPEMRSGRDQLSLLVLCLGLTVISLMFQRCGRGKIWRTEKRGCKKEERSIEGKLTSPKTPV